MANKIKMTNRSEVFKEWCQDVDNILCELPRHSVTGQPLEYSDDEFQTVMRKLQQCGMKFVEFPIYPLNEKLSAELCYDQLKGLEEDE